MSHLVAHTVAPTTAVVRAVYTDAVFAIRRTERPRIFVVFQDFGFHDPIDLARVSVDRYGQR